MRTYEQDAKDPGVALDRSRKAGVDELRAGARCASAARAGPDIVADRPSAQRAHGKTRLITEAVRGTDPRPVTGTPRAPGSCPLAAFAHLASRDTVLAAARVGLACLSGVRRSSWCDGTRSCAGSRPPPPWCTSCP
ncbi:hypothetical protein GCM10017687_81150 [Streptomyces echinatus]